MKGSLWSRLHREENVDQPSFPPSPDPALNGTWDNYDDDKYPDLTHSLFDEDDEDDGGSIIDMVKNSKENEGKDFKLEDDIDHVADLFIKRFRRQILLQKLDSFKRIQELLGRSGWDKKSNFYA